MAAIPAVLADQQDLAIARISIMEKRKEKSTFQIHTLMPVTLVVSEDNNDITSVDDFKGKIVAVKNGTTGAEHAEIIKEKAGIKEVRQFNDSPSGSYKRQRRRFDRRLPDYAILA